MAKLSPTIFASSLLAAAAFGCAPGTDPAAQLPADAQGLNEPGLALDVVNPGESVPFTPAANSAVCAAGGGAEQFILPSGYVSTLIASEGPGFPDLSDMITVNETGPDRGRFLYRTHELGSNAGVSVTDLVTGVTTLLAHRADWERFDGIAWTPWGTLVAAEEATVSAIKDPAAPNAVGGHVYEIEPRSGMARVIPAVGSKSHEGLRFDKEGNFYGISETGPGYVYRFVPAQRSDLLEGQLYALRIVTDLGNRTGWGEWVPLDKAAVLIDAIAEAAAKGATGYTRPEDIEIGGGSTRNDRRGNKTLFVAVTGEDRVLAIDLHPQGGADGQVFVSDYISDGVNAPADFDFPDNLALDRAGNLYITEDPGGSAASGKTKGDDVWFAPFNRAGGGALPIQRFFSITDCDAEPTGVYLSPSGKSLFVNIQHRGGTDPRDQTYAVWRLSDANFTPPR